MSDQADMIRRYIRNSLPHQTGYDPLPKFLGADAYEALEALVAERDRLREALRELVELEALSYPEKRVTEWIDAWRKARAALAEQETQQR